MVQIKYSERRKIETWFNMQGGYVLDFTNRTFDEFFKDELKTDIYSQEYLGKGASKANRLRAFLAKASARQAGKALRALWTYKTKEQRDELARLASFVPAEYADPEELELRSLPLDLEDAEFEALVLDIERRSDSNSIAATRELCRQYNLDTVLNEVERASEFVNDDPEDAITASCSLLESVFRSILIELGIELPRDLSIRALFQAVRTPLGLSPADVKENTETSEDVRSVLAALANVIYGIGKLRTHTGDAHGREKGRHRVDPRIAKLAVNSASAAAVFIIETWAEKFPDRALPNADTEHTQ